MDNSIDTTDLLRPLSITQLVIDFKFSLAPLLILWLHVYSIYNNRHDSHSIYTQSY